MQKVLKAGRYMHIYNLDTVKQVNKRVRYNIWQAISDIGGFKDGLTLIVSTFLYSVASTLFVRDLTKTGLKETVPTPGQQKRRFDLANAINE